MGKLTIKILLFLIFLSAYSAAAVFQRTAGVTDSLMRRTDSLKTGASENKAVLENKPSGGGEVSRQTDTAAYVMHKSPLGAVLRSAVLPGWGQVYNRSYWKVPVVWGFIAFYSYYWIDNNKKYRDYIGIVSQTNNPLSQYYGKTSLAETNRDFYRDQRDLFAIYIGLTYALNLLDAYVDAQLFDFSVEEDPRTSSARLSVKLHF